MDNVAGLNLLSIPLEHMRVVVGAHVNLLNFQAHEGLNPSG